MTNHLTPKILRLQRTDEERQRRRVHGDRGAKFSAAKKRTPRNDEISNTITTFPLDNLLLTADSDPPSDRARLD